MGFFGFGRKKSAEELRHEIVKLKGDLAKLMKHRADLESWGESKRIELEHKISKEDEMVVLKRLEVNQFDISIQTQHINQIIRKIEKLEKELKKIGT